MFKETAIPFGHLEINGSKNIPEAAVVQNLKGIKRMGQKRITFGIGQQKSPWSGFGVDPNESSQNWVKNRLQIWHLIFLIDMRF